MTNAYDMRGYENWDYVPTEEQYNDAAWELFHTWWRDANDDDKYALVKSFLDELNGEKLWEMVQSL